MSGYQKREDGQTRKCEECGALFSVTAKERRAKVWSCRTCRKPPEFGDAVFRSGRWSQEAGIFPLARNRRPVGMGGRR